MRIENCLIITSKESIIEMSSEELRYFFAGNKVIKKERFDPGLAATGASALADDDPAAA